MGAGGARSGGGGSGVPDMIRPPKVRRKEVFKETISKIKTPTTAILKGIGEQIKKGKESFERLDLLLEDLQWDIETDIVNQILEKNSQKNP